MSQTDLAELYARQAPKARHLAYLLTGDRLLAEDLVQDCFVKLAGCGRPTTPRPTCAGWSSTPRTATTAGCAYDATGPATRR